jgi:two-component system cell cycle sensor histidine kinase/response regulator CckA
MTNSIQAIKRRQIDLLQDSEKRYRRLFESAKDGILILDADTGKVVDVNPYLLQLLGYSYNALCGQHIWELGAFKDVAASRDAFKTLQDNEYIRYADLPLQTLDGRLIAVEFISNVYSVDHTKVIQCNIRDISARKRMERVIQEGEEQFGHMFEKSPLGMITVGPDFHFIRANAAFCRMLGYTNKELTSLTFKDITHPDYIEEDVLRVNDLMNGKIPLYQTEKQYVRKDKEVIWGSTTVNVMRDRDDLFLYFFATVEDITRRKQSEEERTRLESQLFHSQKMEAIGTLAGGIAHDFNNILTVISGFSSLIKMSLKKDDPKMNGYIDQVLSSSEKAAQLTKSLLAFSRKQQITPQPLDINNTIKATSKLLKRLLTEDIELKIKLSKKDAIIMADPTQIDQVLFNLATNARDVMPRGGTLIIETNVVELNDEFITAHGYGTPGECILLSVTDTGSGMDKATRERIFEPFFTTKEVGKGTGLGLSTVYGIVKQHNGYITVYSEPNIGTTFHIYFPAVNEIIGGDEEIQPPVKGGDETILIAEDNEGVRLLISRVLTENGYTTIEAVDGVDAVEKFKNTDKIDLLIFDSVMPKKNGRETYDEIEIINPDIKVIFTSGYTKDVFLDKGIQDESFNFLQKPISTDALLRKVREVLDNKRDSH